MVVFEQVLTSRLFQSASSAAGAGWWGFQIVDDAFTDGQPVPLDRALQDSALSGTFVYTASAPDLSTLQKTENFILAIDNILETIGSRALIFLPTGDSSQITRQIAQTVALKQRETQVSTNTGINVPLCNTGVFTAQLAPGALITVNDGGDGLIFDAGDNPSLSLAGPNGQPLSYTFQPDPLSTLHFAGTVQGTFTFTVYIKRSALSTELNWGFQTFIPNPHAGKNGDTILYLAAWLPLADGTLASPPDMLGFAPQINLVNPNNLLAASPTKLFFTGQNSNGGNPTTSLVSFYRTNAGKQITLYPVVDTSNGQQPAALIINPGYLKTPLLNGFCLAPEGDFIMAVDSGAVNQAAYLLCGMSGTETIAFLPFVDGQYPGYRLRFLSNQPSYAFSFPLLPSSPVGPPIDPTAIPLSNQYATAWGTVLPPPGGTGTPLYTAAPKGADLFGLDPTATSTRNGNLLVPLGPGAPLPGDLTFPLIPFAGFTAGTGEQNLTKAQLEQLERQIFSPVRRNIIAKDQSGFSAHAHVSLGLHSLESLKCPYNTTTPSGFISHVRCDGSWDQLLLAQVSPPGSSQVSLQMGFTKLQSQLQSAFQTNDLFLVIANRKFLGDPTAGTFMPPAQQTVLDKNLFFNTAAIGDWKFQASVGDKNQYSDYRNVMIVKGVKGKLTDLVISPEKWTMKDLFGAPSIQRPDGTVGGPDPSQLIPLANWMSDYFQAALAQADNPFFTNFCQLIQNESWTGVLLLRVDIANIPQDLAGILAGVNDPSAFYAHHLGIEISQIDVQNVQQKDASSLFGLVYYVDPNYLDTGPAHPIPPRDMNATYDFTLLTLKALFQNSALKKFDSLAQMILNRVFGSAVKKMGDGGNMYNAILLQGAFQKNGDAPVYSLASTSTNTYELDNNLLTLAEIDSAVMSTRDDGSTSGNVVSWIAMAGFMNFAVVKDTSDNTPKQPDFDIFSFGAAGSSGDLRQGLNFNNLGLRISFDKKSSSSATKNSFADGPPASDRVLEMVEGEISFNIAASTPREQSLYPNFQLELLGLQSGDDSTAPQSMGYLTVATPYGLQGVSKGPWHGLRCKLNLGTPGALASKVNLSSTLLLAWSDTSGSEDGAPGYQALVGIQLPGTGSGGDLFSLQSVIKLSIGVVQLYYNEQAKSFLLLLNEIALKIFGLLKVPPNGATAFFLFGNPNAQDSTGLGWYAIYNQDQPKPPQVAGAVIRVHPRP
jgi:hypothetical protein